MSFIETFFISIGLAMDAFAVATCKGLAMKKLEWKKAIIVGLYFGIFQAVMPIIGYYLGINFQNKIVNIDHWIAFSLLVAIGINMIKEALSKDKEEKDDSINFKNMIVLSIATSIDALAIGITLAFLNCNIFQAASCIGIITFILSTIGVKIGNKFGSKYESKAELIGGGILIILGIKILIEHLGII